jgi:hypothetical protein
MALEYSRPYLSLTSSRECRRHGQPSKNLRPLLWEALIDYHEGFEVDSYMSC